MCSWHKQLPHVIGVGPQWATTNVRQKATVVQCRQISSCLVYSAIVLSKFKTSSSPRETRFLTILFYERSFSFSDFCSFSFRQPLLLWTVCRYFWAYSSFSFLALFLHFLLLVPRGRLMLTYVSCRVHVETASRIVSLYETIPSELRIDQTVLNFFPALTRLN